MRPLTILRPQPGAGDTAAIAAAAMLDPLVMPLFDVVALPWDAPDPAAFDGLLITSANAIRHGAPELQRLHSLPVYAVGKASAAAARQAGFTIASIGEGGVDALLEALPDDLRLLHLCGLCRKSTDEAPQRVSAVPVYDSRLAEPPRNFDQVAGSVVMIHSARAARRFAELVAAHNIDRATIAIVAISERAASAAGTGWERVDTASRPDDATLLALAASLCKGDDDAR